MNVERQGVFVIESNGDGVWVNCIFGCVARFGKILWDVNDLKSFVVSSKGTGAHGFTCMKDWAFFVKTVSTNLGVQVYDNHRPTRLNDGNP